MVKSIPPKIDIPSQDSSLKEIECKSKQEPKNYKVYQSGNHLNSDFIQVYVPNKPCRKNGKTKAVIYMHGFALCMPKFYEEHLQHLANKGYYVLFPDFQKSYYPNKPDSDEKISDKNQIKLISWLKIIIFIRYTFKLLFKGKIKRVVGKISVGFRRIRLFLAISIILLLILLFVDRRYGKHLIKLIRTVRYSLLQSPLEWIKNAMNTTDNAWEILCEKDSQLKTAETDFYLFGHSLGGFLALSWISYLNKNKTEFKSKFYPQQILVADPVPNTKSGIPKPVTLILKILRFPLMTKAIDIKKIGGDIDVPVGILHGGDDKLVKPAAWTKPGLFSKKSNFDYIASDDKKIYFSLSDKSKKLFAFHNQSVTNTEYFSDALFKHFGGVKHEANAYNDEYIWPGLDLIIEEPVKASQLLNKFPLKTIKVVDKLPKKAFKIKLVLIIVLSLIALSGLGYFLWSQANI